MIRVLKYFDGKDIQEIRLVKDKLNIDEHDGSLNIYHNDQLVKTIFTSNYSIDFKDEDEQRTDEDIMSDEHGF
ncbi:hypothetical protein [Companilactobacillus jidongensis]|uniref:hypothetical protein n=1 Tax=Companilactobacillus jidongensis TaxID=2486006 RepID=UPI000F77D169|nr:hypothetical protein [Companilactobacillus jidongensis]